MLWFAQGSRTLPSAFQLGEACRIAALSVYLGVFGDNARLVDLQ